MLTGCQALRRLFAPQVALNAPCPAFPVSAPNAGRNPLGRPAKHVKIRRPHRLPIAAAPTLIGLAAAFCLSAAPAGAATVSATAHHAAADRTGASSATLTAL